MKLLETQEQFESMWFGTTETKPWIIYFTAKWCGPCRRLNSDEIGRVAEEKGIDLWKCDIDANDYTPGYCGVTSIPYFMYFEPKKIVSSFQSSDTESVAMWIRLLK